MAKSLRASSKVKARNARRYTTGSDYQVANAARLHALNKRLMARAQGKTGDEEVDEEEEEEEEEQDSGIVEGGSEKTKGSAETMDTDAGAEDGANDADEPKKISTSGTRESRRETWRKARGWKPKRGTKNGGKPKRRR